MTALRWRSLLFVPSHVDRFVSRAHERGADGIILDLEDAVPPAEKPAARERLAASIASVGQNGAAAIVRVNHGLRDLARDLEAAVVPGLAAIALPKVEDAGFVKEVAATIDELEAERGIAPGTVRLILQVETPVALFSLPAIAGAHPRVAAMTLGPEDYVAAMGAVSEPEALFQPSYAVLLAARAAGIMPLGFVGSLANTTDLETLATQVRQARRLGFRGAMIVHPAQVPIMNEGFAPTAEEVAWATRVVEADAKARAEGRGAFMVDGRMADAPVVRRAEDILARAG
jgi:citrate lyase subunit beta/citryl-CoA lyase